MRHLSALAMEIISVSLSPYHGTSVMASVNYRRRAGNLIDRDKRSNCRGGRARPVAIFFLPRPSAKLIFDIMFTESAARIVNSYHVKLSEYFAKGGKVCPSEKYTNIFIINPEKKLASVGNSQKLY